MTVFRGSGGLAVTFGYFQRFGSGTASITLGKYDYRRGWRKLKKIKTCMFREIA